MTTAAETMTASQILRKVADLPKEVASLVWYYVSYQRILACYTWDQEQGKLFFLGTCLQDTSNQDLLTLNSQCVEGLRQNLQRRRCFLDSKHLPALSCLMQEYPDSFKNVKDFNVTWEDGQQILLTITTGDSSTLELSGSIFTSDILCNHLESFVGKTRVHFELVVRWIRLDLQSCYEALRKYPNLRLEEVTCEDYFLERFSGPQYAEVFDNIKRLNVNFGDSSLIAGLLPIIKRRPTLEVEFQGNFSLGEILENPDFDELSQSGQIKKLCFSLEEGSNAVPIDDLEKLDELCRSKGDSFELHPQLMGNYGLRNLPYPNILRAIKKIDLINCNPSHDFVSGLVHFCEARQLEVNIMHHQGLLEFGELTQIARLTKTLISFSDTLTTEDEVSVYQRFLENSRDLNHRIHVESLDLLFCHGTPPPMEVILRDGRVRCGPCDDLKIRRMKVEYYDETLEIGIGGCELGLPVETVSQIRNHPNAQAAKCLLVEWLGPLRPTGGFALSLAIVIQEKLPSLEKVVFVVESDHQAEFEKCDFGTTLGVHVEVLVES